MVGYKISRANEYLVVTGLGIPKVKVVKKAFVWWPFQKFTQFTITPHNYTLSLFAMTSEKLEFVLPAVFTIGPRNDLESLDKYARLLAPSSRGPQHLEELVTGIIEGETRVIAAGMTIEEIFKERKFFKENVIKSVQSELDQFGLFIYNANVKQLTDTEGSEYFVYLRLKSHEGAINQAKVDVAEAKYLGDVGEKKRLGLTRQECAAVEAVTVIFENQKQVEVSQSNAKLAMAQAAFNRDIAISHIEAKKAAAAREAELQKDVEIKRAAVEQERLRADNLTKVTVQSESIKVSADAQKYKLERDADGKLYKETKVAQGAATIFESQAEGVGQINKSFHDIESTLKYIMLEKDIYTKLAKANAGALQGLSPQITVWNTGKNGGQGGDSSNGPISGLFQALPPLLSTVEKQTGLSARADKKK